jgi:hypothetical protein
MRSARKRSIYGYNTFATWVLVLVLGFFAVAIGVVPVRAMGQGFYLLPLLLQIGVLVLATMSIRFVRQALRERIELQAGRLLYFPANSADPEVISDDEIEALETRHSGRGTPLYELVYRGGRKVDLDPVLLSRWEELARELRRRVAGNEPRARCIYRSRTAVLEPRIETHDDGIAFDRED